jgi:hypothetical protein
MYEEHERSADRLDQAADWEENERQVARLLSRKPVLTRTGRCRDKACGAPLSDPQALFCDADCRNAWEREQAAQRRLGR